MDTCVVNRILDLDVKREEQKYEVDRKYLRKIIDIYVKREDVCFYVNPSVKQEIEKTKDPKQEERLLKQFKEFDFSKYNKTIFPFEFPTLFATNKDRKILKDLEEEKSSFRKDRKIFIDALADSKMSVLLTTDRKHLANDKTRNYIQNNNLESGIRIFLPEEFFGYLKTEIFS